MRVYAFLELQTGTFHMLLPISLYPAKIVSLPFSMVTPSFKAGKVQVAKKMHGK